MNPSASRSLNTTARRQLVARSSWELRFSIIYPITIIKFLPPLLETSSLKRLLRNVIVFLFSKRNDAWPHAAWPMLHGSEIKEEILSLGNGDNIIDSFFYILFCMCISRTTLN